MSTRITQFTNDVAVLLSSNHFDGAIDAGDMDTQLEIGKLIYRSHSFRPFPILAARE